MNTNINININSSINISINININIIYVCVSVYVYVGMYVCMYRYLPMGTAGLAHLSAYSCLRFKARLRFQGNVWRTRGHLPLHSLLFP